MRSVCAGIWSEEETESTGGEDGWSRLGLSEHADGDGWLPGRDRRLGSDRRRGFWEHLARNSRGGGLKVRPREAPCAHCLGVLGVRKARCVCAPTGDLEVESTHALRGGRFTGTAEFMPTPTGSSAWECFWGGVCVCIRVPVHMCAFLKVVCVLVGGLWQLCALHRWYSGYSSVYWESWAPASKGCEVERLCFFLLLFLFLFFPLVFICWRLITLQYWGGFCHTLT